jgi:micrococcal nuclease
MKRKIKLIVIILLAAGLAYAGIKMQAKDQPGNQLLSSGFYRVGSIADGDTITVDMEGKKEKIRFIGVDTPEVAHDGDPRPAQCYADKAKGFTESLIAGREVELRADKLGSNRDKYGRLLRYVYSHDGRPIDELLISGGYGFAVDGFSYTKKAEFLSLMKQAEERSVGLWSECRIDRSKGYPEVAN